MTGSPVVPPAATPGRDGTPPSGHGLGAALLTATDVTTWLAAESSTGKASRFTTLEKAVAAVLTTSAAGTPPIVLTASEGLEFSSKVPATARALLNHHFDLPVQQGKGAWWLPENVSVKPGLANLFAHVSSGPKWAMTSASSLDGRYATSQPPALASWALLAPLVAALLEPLLLRGPDAGKLTAQERNARWAAIDALYRDVNLDSEPVETALAPLRPGAGWAHMSTAEQLPAKQAFAAALGSAVDADTVRRWRVLHLQPLVERYYAKSTRGPATAAAVLTKALHPALCAWFAGDWLSFLDWLDEQPAAGEQILASLPEPRLIVETGARAADVAVRQGLEPAAVEAILASFHGGATADSLVERRVRVLRSWWQQLDAVHAAQRPGTRPLVSLISTPAFDVGTPAWPCPQPITETLFPSALLSDIDELWGSVVLPATPGVIVSSIDPHAGLPTAFGGGASFWHELALTCWFICEGPYARTDLAHLAETYSGATTELAAGGTPVPEELFTELRAASKRLGRPKDIVTDREVISGAYGLQLETSFVRGQRREGFEILRDILTRHRRAWAADHLDAALRAAWERPLREVAEKVHRAVAARGKPPTARQLATMAAPTANAWFGGDLAALCAALGEPAPIQPVRSQLMPFDRAGLARRVFEGLGGRQVKDANDRRLKANAALLPVIRDVSRFVQLEEALARPPTAKELFKARTPLPEQISFERFAVVVTSARNELPVTRAGAPSSATDASPRTQQVPRPQPQSANPASIPQTPRLHSTTPEPITATAPTAPTEITVQPPTPAEPDEGSGAETRPTEESPSSGRRWFGRRRRG